MNSKDRITEQLKQIVKKDQVLTDLEDRYVYSFEKIFLEKFDISPDIIVRVSSLKKENEVKRFIEKENAILIERGKILSYLENVINIKKRRIAAEKLLELMKKLLDISI